MQFELKKNNRISGSIWISIPEMVPNFFLTYIIEPFEADSAKAELNSFCLFQVLLVKKNQASSANKNNIGIDLNRACAIWFCVTFFFFFCNFGICAGSLEAIQSCWEG